MLGLRVCQRIGGFRPLVQFSTHASKIPARASSIPVINQVVAESRPSQVCLVQHPYKLDGYQAPGTTPQIEKKLFAVVDFSGTQYKVIDDDVIVADKMDGYDIGQIVKLDKVLLVGSRTGTLIGKPLIAGAQVLAVVEEMARDKKVMTLKFRRRKNSKNIRGFRRELTILRIKEITLNEELSKDLGV